MNHHFSVSSRLLGPPRALRPISRLFSSSISAVLAVVALTMNSNRPAWAADPTSQPEEVDPTSQVEEVEVTGAKQTAIDAEAISLSDTPDAEPSVGGITTYVVGLAARVAPVYDGSKTTKVSPFPYVDIHGLWHDRLFVSDLRGLGINLFKSGGFRAGTSVNYSGGRTSSDASRLRGLPDISNALSVAGFVTYTIKPFSFEVKVDHEFGSQPSNVVSVRASYLFVPTPRWHVSAGVVANWNDSKYNQKFYGITPAEAAEATAQGNPLTPYRPGSSIGTVGLTTTSVYALTEHWGIVTRFALRDVAGSAAKDSPLTDRANGVDFGMGAIYKF
jgi:MipA family protein